MKVKDSHFCRFFINNIHTLNSQEKSLVLNSECNTDSYSLTHFLFSSLFKSLNSFVSESKKDIFSIELLQQCNDYVNFDLDNKVIGPPVIVSFDKINLCSFFDSMFIKPIYQGTKKFDVLFLNSNFIDACVIVNNKKELNEYIKHKKELDYPLIIANNNLKNEASLVCDILLKHLKLNFGEEKTCDIIKSILTSAIADGMISSYKILSGNLLFTPLFVEYLMNFVSVSEDQKDVIKNNINKQYSNNGFMKTALDTYNSTAPRQWTEWAALVGLTEKQLEPSRGPLYPGIRFRKLEEELSKKIIEEKKNNKNVVNLERLLEIMREHNDLSNIEPGVLPEILLRDNRVWK